jgi:hypothetical protein
MATQLQVAYGRRHSTRSSRSGFSNVEAEWPVAHSGLQAGNDLERSITGAPYPRAAKVIAEL